MLIRNTALCRPRQAFLITTVSSYPYYGYRLSPVGISLGRHSRCLPLCRVCRAPAANSTAPRAERGERLIRSMAIGFRLQLIPRGSRRRRRHDARAEQCLSPALDSASLPPRTVPLSRPRQCLCSVPRQTARQPICKRSRAFALLLSSFASRPMASACN